MNPDSTQRSGPGTQLETALEENSRYKDQIYFLTEMGSLLGQFELSLLLGKILELTTEFVGADVGSIVLANPGGELETAVDWGMPHEVTMDLRGQDGGRIVDHVLAAGKPQWFRGQDLRPVLDGAYAIAVENEQLVHMKLAREREQQQLKLAQQIQRRLLPPQAPEVPGLELAAAYIPAIEIGGDYYDYLTLRDGSIGLVIADVAGKGVAAGLVMTAVRSMFRTACRGTSQPARLLQQVNEQLCREHLDGFFVTAACLRIDVERGLLTVSVAGHEPVLVLRGSRVEPGGAGSRRPSLGLVDKAVYREESFPFEPGDAFVLYTDGVTEAMNDFRNQFGARRLQETLSGCVHCGAHDLVHRITEAVAHHVGNAPRHDDVTLLVGRRMPS